MDQPVYISFLWHMHQPLYMDWERGWLALPWVRLHALKAYYDMPWVLEGFPDVQVTINLVPSLLYQIEHYLAGGTDYFLELSRKPAAELNTEEKLFLLKFFFCAHEQTMIQPYPGYWRLLQKRGNAFSGVSEALKQFHTADFRDLQVWFNLTWVGFAYKNHPLIRELRLKGQGFSEEEKLALLDLHHEILKGLLPLYRKRKAEGQIEISTSPAFHPILPLLIDTDFARRNLPNAPLPPRFAHPEDASLQIKEALSCHERIFGQRPQGMWPSEGSVCPELIPLAAEAGVQWLATDEEILYRSLGQSGPHLLLQPYWAEHAGARIAFFFRHHALSDRIGFVYRAMAPEKAVEDLLSAAKSLAQGLSLKRPPLLCLILDGENPWEYYPDGGEAFLKALYQRLQEDSGFRAVSIGNYLAEFPPERGFAELYTGSWINANFDIWIGHEEENKAWSILGQVRNLVKDLSLLPEQGLRALLAAEGSDWFWWFGDHFTTIFDLEFDRLFRGHLKHALCSLGLQGLNILEEPIRRPRLVEPEEQPASFIQPVIDGRLSSFFEWSGAGKFTPRGMGEAMYLGPKLIEALYFGFDLHNLYLRLDFREKSCQELPPGTWFKIFFMDNEEEVEVFLEPPQALKIKKGKELLQEGPPGEMACMDILEVRLSFKSLGFSVGQKVRFWVEIGQNDLLKERLPWAGELYFVVPDETFEQIMWQV